MVLASETLLEKIQLTLTFWKGAPLENPLLDWDNCANWPSPWELINDNRFCDSTLSLAVANTLVMADPDNFKDAQLALITDRENHVQKIVVITHDRVLNLGWLDVTPREAIKQAHINRRWKHDGKIWRPSS